MAMDYEALFRRENFARDQQRERIKSAEKSRKERQEAQDRRDAQNRAEREARDIKRASEKAATRQASQNFTMEMHGKRRADKLADQEASAAQKMTEQGEITRREQLLQELAARLYPQRLQDDYEHDVQTRELDVQEYAIKGALDTKNSIAIANNTAANENGFIIANLRALLIEKAFDHVANEQAKKSASRFEIRRIEAEGRRERGNIDAQSDADVRMVWEENEAKKDFELFMRDLNRKTRTLDTEEISDILDGLSQNQ